MTIRQLSSRVVYRNTWMTVREDEIERDNGARGIYGVVEKYDSAIILAIDGDQVYLVEQYRYPLGSDFAGVSAGQPGEERHRSGGDRARRTAG